MAWPTRWANSRTFDEIVFIRSMYLGANIRLFSTWLMHGQVSTGPLQSPIARPTFPRLHRNEADLEHLALEYLRPTTANRDSRLLVHNNNASSMKICSTAARVWFQCDCNFCCNPRHGFVHEPRLTHYYDEVGVFLGLHNFHQKDSMAMRAQGVDQLEGTVRNMGLVCPLERLLCCWASWFPIVHSCQGNRAESDA